MTCDWELYMVASLSSLASRDLGIYGSNLPKDISGSRKTVLLFDLAHPASVIF